MTHAALDARAGDDVPILEIRFHAWVAAPDTGEREGETGCDRLGGEVGTLARDVLGKAFLNASRGRAGVVLGVAERLGEVDQLRSSAHWSLSR